MQKTRLSNQDLLKELEITRRRLAELNKEHQQSLLDAARVEREQSALVNELNAFAHTVAHDLKAPLAIITGYAGLLADLVDEMNPEERHQMIRAIENGAVKMGLIVDELLLFASTRQLDEVEICPLEMGSIIGESLTRLQMLIDERNAVIKIHQPDNWPTAKGHIPWVEEVWANYISNAIKYGGTPPVVSLGAERLANGSARFWVGDNGQGIPHNQQEQLFKMYSNLKHVRMQGHGLGLSIVERIVNKLGGVVSVESAVGEGSTFSFTLPLWEESKRSPMMQTPPIKTV
jgi:signal transduction histidine kinase